MRVIVPFTCLSAGCEESLDLYAPHAERVDVSDDPLGYWRLLCRVWADREDFILIEHDVTFEAATLDGLERCPLPFCTAGQWFRLTRFRSQLMTRAPRLFSSMPVSQRHWIALEWMARLRLEKVIGRGYHDHVQDALQAGKRPSVASNQPRGLVGRKPAGLFTSGQRWPVWAQWLRTLPPEDADDFTQRAWAEVLDDGRSCERPACRRRFVGPFPTTCDHCRHDAGPVFDQYGMQIRGGV